MNLFYTPEYAKTGDVIPFYNQKTKRFACSARPESAIRWTGRVP